ncbi:uncharacterized protein LOC111696926 [Eurytemora carolleeae]|uniref:uncharacterized protein LOC111696926 n=1 Tax=Eurytemora carolleeae TaxID=1294199 RepID=UPI000C78C7EA|nr:uncharacterized protein LOC111696926 [Eurytemora carolleeae]|eukprot:XP_023322484.1 uncharacterized protein LOC111696926 [Eurytemora affinis]
MNLLDSEIGEKIRVEIDKLREDLGSQLSNANQTSSSRESEVRDELRELSSELRTLFGKMETISTQLEDVQEKMYDFEQNKRNNLIFYGLYQEFKENQETLRQKIVSLLKQDLNIRRDLPIVKATRIYTGPEVQGTRPVLVTFENFKDREDVLKNSKVLKKSAVTVTEDLSKRTRESRQELRRFMRQIKKKAPERVCRLEYDKLYLDHKIYVWNDIRGQVVEISEVEKVQDSGFRSNSAAPPRGGLARGLSLSSPNVSGDPDLLDRIRGLERQIQIQQSIISEQRQQIATTGDGAASIGMAAVEEAANVGKAVEDEQQINGIISSDEKRCTDSPEGVQNGEE